MNLRHVVAAAFVLGITACATSTPQQATSPEPTEPPVVAEGSVTESSSDAAESELKVVDVPDVPEESVVANSQNSDLICRYEKEVGSHMRTRVCRWRERVEEERIQTQETLRKMSRGSNSSFSE